MDIQDIKTLLLDMNCMTALRFTMEKESVKALIDLCLAIADESISNEDRTEAYCNAYNAWLNAVARGMSGFAQDVLETILYSDSDAARLCAKGSDIPYSLMSGLGHDLQTLRQLTAIEPPMFLLLCERAGLCGSTAARLPVWEPMLEEKDMDPRIEMNMLSFDGTAKVIDFFAHQGTGIFARYPACTWVGVSEDYPLGLRGVAFPDPIRLEDLILYEKQKNALIENTQHLIEGRNAGNVLLYGDKGTGKSATVKAMLGNFWEKGLRIIEVTPQHLTHLPEIFALLREQPCSFIVFVDDLAFNDSCPEYTALKTVLEGGLEVRPSNVVVYATSNRRNIVRQRFSEREDDVNERDTLEEKFSLADRFDMRLTFAAPNKDQYLEIVRALLQIRGIEYDEEQTEKDAMKWTVTHSGLSPRIARQFADYVCSLQKEQNAENDEADDQPEEEVES